MDFFQKYFSFSIFCNFLGFLIYRLLQGQKQKEIEKAEKRKKKEEKKKR